jgi:hypothetical protein
VRQNESDKVFAVFNFSAEPQTIAFKESLHHGAYTDYFNEVRVELDANSQLALKPWDYRVFVR